MTGGVGETYINVMIKGETPSAWGRMAANEGEGEPSPGAADSYWEDISLQASARLAKFDEERKQHAVEQIRRPYTRGRFGPRLHRLVLTVAVSAILIACVAYALLKVVPSAALLPP